MDSSTATAGSYSLTSQRLLGKVALVTGGADGIGEGIVRLFHRHGAKICIVDIQDTLGGLVRESLVGENGDDVTFLHCDVTKEDDVSRAVDFTVEKYGSLDVIVNNAGVTGNPNNDENMDGLHSFWSQKANLQGVELTIDDVANAVLFLASEDSNYVSGLDLLVDGGFSSSNHNLQGMVSFLEHERLKVHG